MGLISQASANILRSSRYFKASTSKSLFTATLATMADKMEYVRLGNSGLKISPIILGCMSYGSSEWMDWVLDEEASLPLIKYAYDSGINTWDTADVYSNGISEELVGKALKKYSIPRHRVVILSKCYFGVADDGTQPGFVSSRSNTGAMTNRVGLSRKHIMDAVDDSVRRLGTYIDVLQIHRLDRETPREEIMRALNDVVESGKVRYIGASSMAAWEFQSLQNVADKHGWHKFISMQNYYNLIYREEEREMIPYCRDAGVSLIPWSPLARGILARPYNEHTIRESSDVGISRIRATEVESDKKIIDRVEELAKKYNVAMATIATAWSLSHESVNPIVGLSSKARIDQALESIKFFKEGKLTKEDIEYLEEPYVPKVISGY